MVNNIDTPIKISIITINFNNLNGLKRTVESVINQTYKNIEYIIIDGGSTDGSAEYIEQMQQHFAYWVSEPDNGIYNAMNKGIEKATGEYCHFLNSGDYYYSPDTLNKTVLTFDSYDIIYGAAVCANESGIHYPPFNISLIDLYRQNIINHQAAFILTELLKETPYNEEYKIASDWEFFFQRMLDNKSFKGIRLPICYYEPDGISRIVESKKTHADERKKIITQKLPPCVINDYELLLKLRFNRLYPNYIKVIDNKKLTKFIGILLSIIIRLANVPKK